VTATTERLDAITARAKNQPAYSWPHEAQEDREYLLDLARKQATALEAVDVLADWIRDSYGDYISREIEGRIRAALEATL
jgi:hypothetical protein